MARKGIERERQRLHRRFAEVDPVTLERQQVEVVATDLDLVLLADRRIDVAQEAQVERLGHRGRDGQVGRGARLYDIGAHLAPGADPARNCADVCGQDKAIERDEAERSEEHTSELQSLMRNSYAVFCLKKKTSHT